MKHTDAVQHGKKWLTEKRCGSCRKTLPVSEYFPRKDGYLTSYCRTCSATGTRRYRESSPESRLIHSAKSRAKLLGLEYNITIDDVSVPEFCPIFGIPITREYTNRSDNTLSLDRMDNSKGYIKGNVVVVSWRANRLKNSATIKELQSLAQFYATQ